MKNIILASTSRTRQSLLDRAGVPFHAIPAHIDEEAVKERELARDPGLHPRDLAAILAREKALSLANVPQKLIVAADQTLSLDGRMFSKAQSEEELRVKLRRLRGRTHYLHVCAVCAREGQVIFEHADEAALTMRDFSDDFLESYIRKTAHVATTSVGGYQLEGLGIQLFEAVEGNYFTILGLPLLPVLGFLRQAGELDS